MAAVDGGHQARRLGQGRAHVAERLRRRGLRAQPLRSERVSAGGLTMRVTSPVVSAHPDAAPAAGHGAHP